MNRVEREIELISREVYKDGRGSGCYKRFMRDFSIDEIELFDKQLGEAIDDADHTEAIQLVRSMVNLVESDYE